MRDTLGREPSWDEIIDYAKQKECIYEGASIFDPVLCELLYKWFCTNGGSVDPSCRRFCSWSVLPEYWYPYNGIDLRLTK
jgi:hypothetical protein